MDWKNIDLNSNYEKDQPILDSYSTEQLLLEIECNLDVITTETVRQQFLRELHIKVKTAKEVFEDNLKNFVAYANEQKE